MKKTTTFFLFILSITFSVGQSPYFNDWFAADPDRPFVKLLVSEDAIYEVAATDLLAAGHDLSQAAPDSIKMYYRGEEIPLTVEQDALGRFALLTFYGKRNDGRIEAQMYRNPITHFPDPSQQANPDFSLYTDTAAYFLTWGKDSGLRYQTVLDTNYSNYTPAVSYPFEMVWEPHPDSTRGSENYAETALGGGNPYSNTHTLNCDFGTGEGYVGHQSFSNRGAPLRTSLLHTPDPIAGIHDVHFQLGMFHRTKTPHHPSVSLARDPSVIILDTLYPYQIIHTKGYTRILPLQLLPQTDLIFQDLTPIFEYTPSSHLTYIKIRYQRNPNLQDKARTRISDLRGNATTYFRFANALGQNKVWAYDPANGFRYEGQILGGAAHLLLSGRFYGKNVEVVTDQGFKKPTVAPQTSLRNLCHPDSGAQFVIIAHRKVDTSAYAYAAYRDTTTAGHEPLSAKVIFIDEIYDEFSYGAPTPQAIQQFVNCALDHWRVKPKYIFLWGKGSVWLRGRNEPVIPSYGYPANDVRFTTPWGGNKTSQVTIGRVNIYNNQEGMAYLNKVKIFERKGEEAWRKEAIMLGAPFWNDDSVIIKKALSDYESCFEQGDGFSGNATTYLSPSNTLNMPDYHTAISNGVGLLFFMGHISSNTFINYPVFEAFEYQNFDRTPLFVGLGSLGGYWAGRESFSERWVKEPNRGCIAYLANSSFAYTEPISHFSNILFCQELKQKPNRPIGEIVHKTYQKMVDSLPDFIYLNHARQMNLQGDPALVIFPFGMNTSINPPRPISVQIYPNPAEDKLTISSESDRIEAISLYTLQGQIILEQDDFSQNKVEVDVSELAPGHYFLQYRTVNGVGVEKIVVN